MIRRDLVAFKNAGLITEVRIHPTAEKKGFVLGCVTTKGKEEFLYTDRKAMRRFKSLDAVYNLLIEVGLNEALISTEPKEFAQREMNI